MAPSQHNVDASTIAHVREEMDQVYGERMQGEIERKVKEAEENIEKKMEGKFKKFMARLKGKKKGSSSTEKMRKEPHMTLNCRHFKKIVTYTTRWTGLRTLSLIVVTTRKMVTIGGHPKGRGEAKGIPTVP
ncbi:hypothetical protein LINPERPRIM_LOCUS20769 [Linum perenne]